MKKAHKLLVRRSELLPSDITALAYDASSSRASAALILAHGAGAGQYSQFMTNAAAEISSRGIDVVTFNFPYTEQGRRVPDRQPVLEACYRAVIAVAASEINSAQHRLFIGGKSMGGRIATHVAAADHELPIAGLVLLGYPLHPPGQPGKRRDAHLPSIARPMLFVQGERDTFGTPTELASTLSSIVPMPTLREVPGGDHSLKVPVSRGPSQPSVLEEIFEDVARWIATISAEGPPENRARRR